MCCFQYCITGGSNRGVGGLQIQARNGGKSPSLKQGKGCLFTGSTFWSFQKPSSQLVLSGWLFLQCVLSVVNHGFTGLKSNRHRKQTQEEINSLNSLAKLNLCSDCSIRVVIKCYFTTRFLCIKKLCIYTEFLANASTIHRWNITISWTGNFSC